MKNNIKLILVNFSKLCISENRSSEIHRNRRPHTPGETEYECKKTKQVPIQLPNIARTLFDPKKIIKTIFIPWTSEIIQFIRFENHMDGPRYLKKFLGYAIKYLSIWYFISYGCFTARSVLKFGFVA